MVYLLIVLLEIVILFLLSTLIPTFLTQIFHFFVRSRKLAIYLLSIMFLPGTLVHELAHLLVAGVLLVPVGDISLMPEIKEEGVKLGHVEIQKTDFFRRALIGFAPVFIGLAVLVGGVYFLNQQFFQKGDYPIWLTITMFYLVVVIGNTMFSSRKDLEGTLSFVVLIIAVLGATYLLGFKDFFVFLRNNLIDNQSSFYRSLALFLAVPVIGDILVYILAKLLVKKMY